MAERVPIWYAVDGGQSTSVEIYRNLQNASAQLHRELNLSVAIAIAERAGDEISCVAGCGPAAPPIGTKVSLEHGICAACVRQNRLQLSNDTAIDPMLSGELCVRLGIRSILSVPLRENLRCIGFVAAFSDTPHRFDLLLLERIRTEAATIERHLAGEISAADPATRAVAKAFEFRGEREALSPEPWVNAGVASGYKNQAAGTFAAYGRPTSIAVLTCFAIAMVAAAPRVVRSKTSIAHHPAAEISEKSAHVAPTEAANFKGSTNTDDSRLRDLRERANSGDVGAQALLAARYERGDRLGRDALKACVWYIIAGANGDLAAKGRAVRLSHRLPQFQIAEIRFNVGKMYMQGIGVKRDPVSAYSWFALAQAAGDVRARGEQEKLETSMSRDQVSAGLRRASDWLLAHRSGAGQHTRELAAIPWNSRAAR